MNFLFSPIFPSVFVQLLYSEKNRFLTWLAAV